MIAKISIGGGFRGALDYLMSAKEKGREQGQEQKREQAKERAQEGQPKQAGSVSEKEASAPERTRQKAPESEAQKGGERGEKQLPTEQHEAAELHPSRGRDLADGYESEQRYRIIGGNMGGRTPRELAREFGAFRELRPDIAKPVHHASLSAGKNDRLSLEQWNDIAARYVENMGFKDAPYVVIQHRDTGQDHVHIVTSRIDVNGCVVSEWQNKPRSEAIMREVEREYDLERVTPSREVLRAAPKRGEIEEFNRSGKLSAKMSLQGHVERALKNEPTATQFVENLQRVGVEVLPNLQSTGRVSGISFRQGDELMKGSDLGRGFSWGALQERGLSYDPERDRPAMEAARQRMEMSRAPEPPVTPLMPVSQPERTFAETMSDLARSAVQYELDRLNPLRQIENQVRMIEQAGRGVADLYNFGTDLLSRQDNVEQLDRAAGLESSGQDTLERLHEAAGLEPARDGHDALEQLNKVAGVERPEAALEQALGGTAPTMENAIEHVVEQEVEERTLEIGLELLL